MKIYSKQLAKIYKVSFIVMIGQRSQTPRLYCAANSEDLAEVIEHVRRLHPNVPIGATGISMGGYVLIFSISSVIDFLNTIETISLLVKVYLNFFFLIKILVVLSLIKLYNMSY